jgi:hypothetical protein
MNTRLVFGFAAIAITLYFLSSGPQKEYKKHEGKKEH